VAGWLHESRHCGKGVSNSNITRRKEHLLQCKSFLGSNDAETVAIGDSKLKDAVDKHM
jgi:hypothetical protein